MKQKLFENLNPHEFKEVLDSYNPKDVFLVTGKASYIASGASGLIESLVLQGINFHHFSDFDINPSYNDVVKGVELFLSRNCDLILAIGGGSVIDIAKSINVFQSHRGVNFKELVQGNYIEKTGVPLIAIPTTAGSGSEATQFAVIYLENKKYSLSHPHILPDVAVLDYNYTLSQSKYLTACSGLDALSQAIESLWSVNSTIESREYSIKAIKLILNNLDKSVNEIDNLSRKNVFLGSHYAGRAINIAKTTAPHALSYSFTKFYGIPHGHAVFLTLPSFIKYNSSVSEIDNNDPRGIEFIKMIFSELYELTGTTDSESCSQFFKNYANKIGIDLSLKKNNDIDWDLVYSNVNLERMNNNPRKFYKEIVQSILKFDLL